MLKFIDVVFPHRILLAARYRHAVQQRLPYLLPPPYEPAGLLVRERLESDGQAVSQLQALESPPQVEPMSKEQFQVSLQERVAPVLSGLEAAGLYGVGLWGQYASVDEHIYSGIGHLAGQQFASLADLSAKLQDFPHDEWTGLTQGALRTLQGHVGEAVVFDHLASAGGHVEMADAPNQAGWDLLLQGHEINVKTVADVQSLAHHFDKYPDIPVIVPGDAAHLPADAIHFDPSHGVGELMQALTNHNGHLVIVDDALSHAEMVDHVHNATDAALGIADIHPHVPFITMALTGYREARLLWNSKTDVTTAAGHVASDAIGAGGGAFAGAKAGALVGSIFGPAGTLVGGFAGAVGGAIGGRLFSNKVKRAPLEAALVRYNENRAELGAVAEADGKQAEEAFGRARQTRQHELDKMVRAEQERIDHLVKRANAWSENYRRMPSEEARQVLQQALAEVQEARTRLIGTRTGLGLWRRYFWPDKEVFALDAAIESLDRTEDALPSAATPTPTGLVDSAKFFQALGTAGVARDAVNARIHTLEETRQKNQFQLRKAIAESGERLAGMRVKAFQDLSHTLTELTGRVQEKLAPLINKLRESEDRVKLEAGKLGMSV